MKAEMKEEAFLSELLTLKFVYTREYSRLHYAYLSMIVHAKTDKPCFIYELHLQKIGVCLHRQTHI